MVAGIWLWQLAAGGSGLVLLNDALPFATAIKDIMLLEYEFWQHKAPLRIGP